DTPRRTPAQPVRHIRDSQSIALVPLNVTRARNGLRLSALAAASLPKTKRSIIRNHGKQVIRHGPRSVIIRVQRLVQLGIATQAATNHQQVTPVESARDCVAETQAHAD